MLRDVFSIGVLIDLRDLFLLNLHLVVISDLHLSGDFFVLDFFLVFGFNSCHGDVLLAYFSFNDIQRNSCKRATHLLLSDACGKT